MTDPAGHSEVVPRRSRHKYVFDPTAFKQPDFSSEEFVSSLLNNHDPTQVVTLEQLQHQLQQYSESVHSALIELLNSEYTQFLTLLTNLNGTDTHIQSIQQCGADIGTVIQHCTQAVQADIQQVEQHLLKSDELRRQQQVLQLISSVLQQAEALQSDLHQLVDVSELLYDIDKYVEAQFDSVERDSNADTYTDSVYSMYTNLLSYRDTNNLYNNIALLEKGTFNYVVTRSIVSKLQYFTLVQQLQPKLDAVHKHIVDALLQHLQHCFNTHNKSYITTIYRCCAYLQCNEQLYHHIQHTIVRNAVSDIIDAKHIKAVNNMRTIFGNILHIVQWQLLTLLQYDTSEQNTAVFVQYVYAEIINLLCDNSYYICTNNKHFQHNYVAFRHFVAQLQQLTHTDNLLQHAITQKLLKQFNLSVYYQLVLTQYAETIEKYIAAVNTSKQLQLNKQHNFYAEYIDNVHSTYIMELTALLQQTCDSTLSDKVYIHELSSNFVTLILQTLTRYIKVLNKILDDSAASTSYGVLVSAVHDTGLLQIYIQQSLTQQLHRALNTIDADKGATLIDSILQPSINDLQALQTRLIDAFTAKLVTHSEVSIKKVKKLKISLTQRYNNNAPATVSTFITELLEPLKQLFTMHSGSTDLAALPLQEAETTDFTQVAHFLHQCNAQVQQHIFDTVCVRVMQLYNAEVVELIDIVQKTQKSLQKLNLNKTDANDNNSIYAQLNVDLQHMYSELQQIHAQFNGAADSKFAEFEALYQSTLQRVK